MGLNIQARLQSTSWQVAGESLLGPLISVSFIGGAPELNFVVRGLLN